MLNASTQPILLLAVEQASEKGLLGDPDVWRVINLLIFVLVLFYIFRNKLKLGRMFDSRAVSIRKELEQAKREKEEAHQQLAEIDARLGRLNQEVAEIRVEAEKEAEREAERIREAAAADAEKIQQMARREIEGAMRTARAELRAFVAEQSVDMAEKLIRREFRPEDDKRMLAGYVDELREVKK